MLPGSMLSILMGAGLTPLVDKFKREQKTCIYCDNKHDHNNSFCSKECCTAYKINQKEKNKVK